MGVPQTAHQSDEPFPKEGGLGSGGGQDETRVTPRRITQHSCLPHCWLGVLSRAGSQSCPRSWAHPLPSSPHSSKPEPHSSGDRAHV